MGYFEGLLLVAGIYIILTVSLNLINGICGQFSLGHAGFWAVGAYTSASYAVFCPLNVPEVVNLFIACGIGFVTAAISGLVIGIPCLRLRGDYLAIATLGFGEIIRIIVINTDKVGGPRGFTSIPIWANTYWVYFWVAVTILFMANLTNSSVGRAIISIREDEIAAESMGINTFKYKTYAFVIGAGFAGIAGALFSLTQQFLHPNNFTFMISVTILLMVILGGLGSITGSVVGAMVLYILPEALRQFISEYRMVLYSVLLIVLMLLRPEGIFGKKEISLAWFKKAFGRGATS